MVKIGSICSGMGMALHGLGANIWGIECDPDIADVYTKNHPRSKIICDYVQNVNPNELEDVDCIIATPSCIRASVANPNAGESQEDIVVANAIANILKAKLPKFFILENVEGYKKFESFEIIQGALSECGYYSSFQILNLKDFGIAQSRKRLYLMAVRGGFFLNIQPHGIKKGWYEAIQDLIPTLPDTELADWQINRFPDIQESCLIPDHSNWTPLRKSSEPSITVRAGHATVKAILVRKYGANKSNNRPYKKHEPTFTIRALGRKADNHWHQADVIVEKQVKAVIPRACLRFFGDKETADKIWLPDRKSLAMEVVGNGASWEIMQVILKQISGDLK